MLEMADAHAGGRLALAREGRLAGACRAPSSRSRATGPGCPPTRSTAAWAKTLTPAARARARRSVDPFYKVNRKVHERVFEPGTPGFARLEADLRDRRAVPPGQAAPRVRAGGQGPALRLPRLRRLQPARTSPTCAPRATARRTSATAPAAAPATGMCEVPGHTCVWADAYRRLKPYGEERTMLERPVVVQDNDLRRTSAWGNTFLGRDHYARRAAEEAALRRPGCRPAPPSPSHPPSPRPPPRKDRTREARPFRHAVPDRRREHPRHPRPQADRQARGRARGRLGRHRLRDPRRRAPRAPGPPGPGRRPRLRGRQDQARAERGSLGPGRRRPGRHGGRLRPHAGPSPGGHRRRLAGPQRGRGLRGLRHARRGHDLAGHDRRDGPPPSPSRSTRRTWRCSRRASRPPASRADG